MAADYDELVQFSQKYPWKPHHPASLVRRFLTELISSPDFVYELHDQQGRVAAAVLLDKINNPANDAGLEILGIRPDVQPENIIVQFMSWAKQQTPPHRSGFQFAMHETLKYGHELAASQGLHHFYDTFEMVHSELRNFRVETQPEISKASMSDGPEVFAVLCKAFAQNPDTSIPEKPTWITGFLSSPQSHYYVWRQDDKILGFAHLVENENGQETEVRTLGVLSEYRGQNIGRHLLNHCLMESSKHGYNRCHLTVAVKNKSALNLYMNVGFKSIDQYQCYRMALGAR